MTIRAIATVSATNGTDFTAGNYNVGFSYAVTDGVSDLAGGGFGQIPFTLSQKKADDALRDAVAAKIFVDHSLTIDAGDIYFPAP